MQIRKWLISVASLLVLAPLLVRRESGAVQPQQAATPSGSSSRLAGGASCSGRSCHGALDATPGVEGAYTVWLRDDPHARAYATLFGERSRRIMRNLGDGVSAHDNERCLACHVTPGADTMLARREGVSCESCHGAAKGEDPWLLAHTSGSWTRAQAVQCGMTNVSDAKTQATLCAGCHVGAAPSDGLPARDVDHDLIASGHPRLAFEFTVYRDNLPPHWSPQRKAPPDAWAMGRLVAADASLDLLTYRAGRKKGPWPEFAEYDCFACHTALRVDSWRAANGYYRGRVPGSLPPNLWYTTGLPALNVPETQLSELSRVLSVPLPKETEVTQKAEAVRALIANLLNRPQPKHEQVLAALVADDAKLGALSWDEVMQLTLAVEALTEPDDGRRQHAKQLRPLLTFPLRYDSPAHFRRDKEIDGVLEELRRTLKP